MRCLWKRGEGESEEGRGKGDGESRWEEMRRKEVPYEGEKSEEKEGRDTDN